MSYKKIAGCLLFMAPVFLVFGAVAALCGLMFAFKFAMCGALALAVALGSIAGCAMLAENDVDG